MKLYYYTSTLIINPFPDTPFATGHFKIEEVVGGVVSGEVQPRTLPTLPTIPTRKYKVTITVHENDSSYRYRALMEKTQLVLKFSLPKYVEFPVGTWCEWMNQTFYLGCPANFKKNGPRNFDYTLNMGTLENGMADYKLHNTVDGRLKWSMCAKPEEFIKEIVKNLNERDGAGVWSVGDCIDAPEKTVEFNHTYIDAALQSVADAFGTEYEISEDLTISLHKVEYFKTDPLALSYGRGNGFVPGVGRTSQTDEKPIKRLYVEGTDRNIDRATYGAAELRLPKGKTLKYDGSHFEGEEGFVEANSHTYASDADGTYIYRSDKVSQAVKEDSLDCTEIYPSRIGVVSDLVEVDDKKNFYDIIDTTIPTDLNFSAYIIPGETMTLIFQTGMLAGKEFEVTYHHTAKTVNGVEKAGRRFEIKPQEIDGVMMPNDTFKPVAGGDNPDQYAIFGIQLPPEYICNDDDKSGASWEMFKEAARHLYEHEEQKFTFTGELQGLWAKRNWMEIGGKLKVGGYVLFTDEHFAKDGTLIRITGIKDYLTAPYSPTIEISNSISGSSTTSQNLRTIEQTEVVIKDTEQRLRQFTKRRFRDAKETIEMLDEAMMDNFDNAISPAAVQTMAMLVGDESLQFQFVQPTDTQQEDGSTKRTWQRVPDTIQYDQENKRLNIGHCYIEHLTLDIKSIKANRNGEEYKHWEMEEYQSPVLNEPNKRYYLYAAVSKTDEEGAFVLSSKAIPFAGGTGFNGDVTLSPNKYYLLVGVLNSEYNDERSFASLYGFTEILPGRITTDVIACSDGESYLDLINSALVLGDAFDYNSNGDKTLKLKFLLSENANLGGWIFRNNRLESQDGKLYLDGAKGEVNIGGVIRFATATQGKLTDANLVWLPQTTKEETITVLYDKEHLGKVIKCYNSNPFGGKNWRIALKSYVYSENNENNDNSQSGDIIFSGSGHVSGLYEVIVRPQETVEIAYLQKPYTGNGGPGSFAGRWELVGRFSQELFINETDIGRFPRMIAIGRLVYNNGIPYISGDWWNGETISSKLTPSRLGVGKYRISFSNADVPNGYKVLVSGYGAIIGGSNSIKAGVWETASDHFDVYTSDDASNNDGSFDFMIFAPNWWYNLKSE